MMWTFGIALLSYASWSTFCWLREAKKGAIEKAEVDKLTKRLIDFRFEMEGMHRMYEKRLAAKQEAIDALKKAITDNADAAGIAALIQSELSENDQS